ncbi:hypothetical protein D9M69_585330 [compost metagenome]
MFVVCFTPQEAKTRIKNRVVIFFIKGKILSKYISFFEAVLAFMSKTKKPRITGAFKKYVVAIIF